MRIANVIARGLALSVLFASAALAQVPGYPDRPVKIIVPFAAAGPTDVVARLIAQKLSEKFGQQFYIENIAGAGGNLAMGAAAKAPADGYTILFVSSSFTVNPSLYAKAPYDAEKDFAPVTKAAGSPNGLFVHPDIPAKSVKELVELIRAKGLDLSRLSGALKPSVVVTAADLARAGIRVSEFYAGDLLCPVGKTPLYLGQPAALLIFEDFDAFDQARLALRDATVLKFGNETGPVKMPNYGQFRFTRIGGPTPDAPDVYSTVKNGLVSPAFFDSSGRPIWARLAAGQAYAEAATYGEKIREELAANNPALLMLDREFETQSVDPMSGSIGRPAR